MRLAWASQKDPVPKINSSYYYTEVKLIVRTKMELVWVGWHMPFNPTLWQQRQSDLCEFRVSMVYIESSKLIEGIAWVNMSGETYELLGE